MQSDEIEIDSPPIYDIGHKVRIRKLIRNDGTFPGKDIGETLAKKGDTGYVVSIGTFLQTSYIYAVHFMKTGYVVGCRSKELESAEVTAAPPAEGTIDTDESPSETLQIFT